MNALVKKEIRLLLPTFGICCALSLANLFLKFNNDGSVGYLWIVPAYFFCAAMTVMLALNSFGGEISAGTFSNLLAQPVSRQKIWDTKILLLLGSFLLLGIFWCGSIVIRFKLIHHDIGWLDMFSVVGTFGLAAFTGGLWTVLLLRQVAAAFWFTVLVPGVLLVLVVAFFGGQDDSFVQGMAVSMLGVYSLAGFFFARWLFFRAQDVQWSGGAIVMPEMRARAKVVGVSHRIWRQRMALFIKELQLHQAQFMIAGALLVLHLGVLATRKIGNFQRNSTTEFILESFWALWLVMPLLVGCAAVAEERKLGTHEGQLCLPAKRRTQFALKLCVALGLTLVLGALMPLLLEGGRILPAVHFNFSQMHSWRTNGAGEMSFGITLDAFNTLLPVLILASIAVLIGGISFYVSTLTRNTLQTLAPALAGIGLAWFFLLVATIPWPYESYSPEFLWRGPLVYFIALPVLAFTILALAYRNYQRTWPDWKVSGRNFLALVAALVLSVTLTSAIYHRVWEKLTPFEPPHGAARLTLANPPSVSQRGNEIIVRLPDGKIWTAALQYNSDGRNPLSVLLSNFKVTLAGERYVAGSNWVSVQSCASGLVGIKTDGTLWLSERVRQPDRGGRWQGNFDTSVPFVQIGAETNWSSIAPLGDSELLVKKDGTLWRLGPDHFDFQHEKWPGLQAFAPHRMGTESNWAGVYQNNYQFNLRKTDGSVWGSNQWPTNGQTMLEVETNFVVRSVPGTHPRQFSSTADFGHGLSFEVGVSRDGSFRIWAEQHAHEVPMKNNRVNVEYFWRAVDLQIGTETNWLAVAGSYNGLITLRADGTLWQWQGQEDFFRQGWRPESYESDVLKMVPVRLGTHSDWIAMVNVGNFITLAADGSLWYWPMAPPQAFYDNNNNQPVSPLLDVSHKPQFLGNIFNSGE